MKKLDWSNLAQVYIRFRKGEIEEKDYTEMYERYDRAYKRGSLNGMKGNESPSIQRALYLAEQGESR